MLRTTLKIAFRNIQKGRFFYGINILGLAIAIASSILIYTYQEYENSYDRFHDDYENVYRVTLDLYQENILEVQDAEVYRPLGPFLQDNIPEVVEFTRFNRSENAILSSGQKEFVESGIMFGEQKFFDFFNYEVLSGTAENVLDEPFKVVITESTAKRYFGSIDVVGKNLFFNDAGDVDNFEITAVINDSPGNTHLKFDILISLETQRVWEWSKHLFESWNGNNDYLYVRLSENTDTEKVFNLATRLFQEREEEVVEALNFDPIADIHLYSNKTYEPEINGDYKAVNTVVIAGLLILVLAWVNYINLSTAQSLNRAHEVGVKKVIGSSRIQLVYQFLTESFIVNFFASILAITIVQLTYPLLQASGILNYDINLFNPKILGLLGLLVLASTVLSGIYPAVAISGFKPIEVLKGKSGGSKKGGKLRKALVIIQFSLSGILIGLSLTMRDQINFVINKNMGMDRYGVLVVNGPSISRDSTYFSTMSKFRNDLLEKVSISEVAYSGTVPGMGYEELSSNSGVFAATQADKNVRITFYHHSIDENYIPLMKMEIVAGRNLNSTDKNAVMVNRRGAELMGFDNPEDIIGIKTNFHDAIIVGVVEDFHHHSPKIDFEPMIYWYSQENAFKIPIRYVGEDPAKVVADVEEVWKDNFENAAFDYFFMDQVFDKQYSDDVRTGVLFGLFTSLSIFIAIVGLIGLVSFNTTLKIKEIGIRKILGASVPNLIKWLLMDFVKLVAISIIFSVPVVFYISEIWLEGYAFRIENTPYPGLIAGFLLVSIAVLSGVAQVSRSANANPVDTLRYE